MKIFDPNKPVQTRGGKKARILATDANIHGKHKIIALLEDRLENREYIQVYKADGKYLDSQNSALDLINIPKKHTIERWLIIGMDECINVYAFKPTGSWIQAVRPAAIKKLTIEYTEGEGLD